MLPENLSGEVPAFCLCEVVLYVGYVLEELTPRQEFSQDHRLTLTLEVIDKPHNMLKLKQRKNDEVISTGKTF